MVLMQGSKFPYKNIGEKLKKWRENVHESLDEVSGAVEIDPDMLKKIEAGLVLPSEDILTLLLSHLDVHEYEAKQLLDQAGYGKEIDSMTDEQLAKQILMIMPFDNRVLYSDVTNVTANKNGVVLDFQQSAGEKQNSVARIGMSEQHLERLVGLLTQTLDQLKNPKQLLLPSSSKNKKRQQKK